MTQLDLFADRLAGRDGTFAEARLEPFHGWYPYLEGYSSRLVTELHRRYLPDARTVIDPFAGTGTTVLALAARAIECAYCESNPAMGLVVRTKMAVLRLSAKRRADLAERLGRVAYDLTRLIATAHPDAGLANSYTACFGSSLFFTPGSLDRVLRLRTVCDSITEHDELLGDVVLLAVLAALIPSSLLKRAGDLRFKTPAELADGAPDAAVVVAKHLRTMNTDLTREALVASSDGRLLCEDARRLQHLPGIEADGVITSPPYLNGTNYIRNARLELWFNRYITAKTDLRLFRDNMITAGINDVAGNPTVPDLPDVVLTTVNRVAANAYDDRIPKMIAGYFGDMQAVFEGLAVHCRPSSAICVDIGDSRYGGVPVPTPDLLCAIAERCGFATEHRIPLRTRLSKDKSPLKQEVLVFRRGAHAWSSQRRSRHVWREQWKWFKQSLPHQRSPYTARNWGHPLHSLCSYQGKMKPALAHFLVHCFTAPGESVLDPFSGAGTIPLEAALQGRVASAFDLSVMATALSRAKTSNPGTAGLQRIVDELEEWIGTYKVSSSELKGASAVRFNRPIPEYFNERTLGEILAARAFFRSRADDSAELSFVLSTMLHILHGNRPYALSRRSHPVTPFAPTGPAEYRPLIPRLQKKIIRSREMPLPPGFVAGRTWQLDVRAEWPMENGLMHAIITSPPFYDSTRFYMTNWMRFWFCGWDRTDFDSAAGQFVETLQRQSLEVYRTIFARFRRHLRDDGVVVMHLGSSRKCDMASELTRYASDAFDVFDSFKEDVTHCESHGVRDKGTVTAHSYLVLTPR